MKRSQFVGGFLAMLGIGKAQQWKECVPDKGYASLERGSVTVCTDKFKPAKRGQCPVCGEMSDLAYWRVKNLDPVRVKDGLSRCKRCNSAFWIDYK